jgi:hypothetical protein
MVVYLNKSAEHYNFLLEEVLNHVLLVNFFYYKKITRRRFFKTSKANSSNECPLILVEMNILLTLKAYSQRHQSSPKMLRGMDVGRIF